MPISFTDASGVDKETFAASGAYDAILDIDSRFFIDPASSCPEFQGAREDLEHYCSGVISLLKLSSRPGDRRWKQADKLLTFKEIKGTCLGYSKEGVAGNAIGPTLRKNILNSITDLLEHGEVDPILFELIGAFEEGVGCDRISDLITYVLRERILAFTERVCIACGYSGNTVKIADFAVPYNPYAKSPTLLLPEDILHPLPLAEEFEDIDRVCVENERVRQTANDWFDFSSDKRPTKRQIFQALRGSVEFRDAYVNAYKSSKPRPYDFKKDSEGESAWYENGKAFAEANPLRISAKSESAESLASIVDAICNSFKHGVEDNGQWELLFDDAKVKPRKERYAQRLFAAIAQSYCQANDIDINPEVNNGNGPVDFKFSKGYSNKALVEIKMSASSQLDHCLDVQIPRYLEQEACDKAVYLLIDTGNHKKVQEFANRYRAKAPEVRESIELLIVDASPKESASKA